MKFNATDLLQLSSIPKLGHDLSHHQITPKLSLCHSYSLARASPPYADSDHDEIRSTLRSKLIRIGVARFR